MSAFTVVNIQRDTSKTHPRTSEPWTLGKQEVYTVVCHGTVNKTAQIIDCKLDTDEHGKQTT